MTDVLDRALQTLTTLKDRFTEMIAAEYTDERHDDWDYTALVGAKPRPRPYAGTGSIALAEPDDRYEMY